MLQYLWQPAWFSSAFSIFNYSISRMDNCAESKILFLQREVDFNSLKLYLESVVLYHHPHSYIVIIPVFGAGFAYAKMVPAVFSTVSGLGVDSFGFNRILAKSRLAGAPPQGRGVYHLPKSYQHD